MSNQNVSTNQPIDQPPADWRDVRRAERAEWRAQRHEWHHSLAGSWVGGLVLILLGTVLLLENFGGVHSDNWWALLILIPAIGSFGTAWNFYHQTGRLTRSARGALFGGVILLAIATTFLFDWKWELVLPILLIIAGISALINSVLPD